jgi:uncharacterized protein YdeI (YjbR/CyaY-like superfamily)
MEPDETAPLTFASANEWERWLEENHDSSDGVWLRIAKKGSDEVTLTIGQALDLALCFGWIDSRREALDEDYYLQRYSPRRARSNWSQLNIAKVAALTDAGRMRPAGLAEVERAKADGRWEAAGADRGRIGR